MKIILKILKLEVLSRNKTIGFLLIILLGMTIKEIHAQKLLYNIILKPHAKVGQSGRTVGVYTYEMMLNNRDTVKYYLDATDVKSVVADLNKYNCYIYDNEKSGHNELEQLYICLLRNLNDCLLFDNKNFKFAKIKFYVDIEYDDDVNNLERYLIKKEFFFKKQIEAGRMFKLIRVLKLHKIEF